MNKFFNPKWHWQCKCGAVVAKEMKCPLCEEKDKVVILFAETERQKTAKDEFIRRNQKLNQELKGPDLKLYHPKKDDRGWENRGRKLTMGTIKELESEEE